MASSLDLKTRSDARGRLTFLEAERDVPFPIRRVYYMQDVPVHADRGHHAHRQCRQAMIVLRGAVTLVLDDGRGVERIRLDRPDRAHLIEPMVWHTLEDFLADSIVLVLASHPYDEADYIRNEAEFRRLVSERP